MNEQVSTGGGQGSFTGTEKGVCTQACPLRVSGKQAVPALVGTSSARADSRPRPLSSRCDELLVPRGLSAFGLDDITRWARHTECTAPSPRGLRDPLSSTLRRPRGCPWTGAGGPWGQGPPPPNPLQAKPVPSSKLSQSLCGRCRRQRAVTRVSRSALLGTQGLGLQEDALHGRHPLLVLDVEGLKLQAGRDNGVTGRRGRRALPGSLPLGLHLCNPP